MNIDFTPTLTSLIAVLVASLIVLVATEVVPRARKLWQPFREQWPMEAVFLEQQAALAVNAAEQYVDGPGKAKLRYALDYVEGQANKYGYSFDETAVQTMIESKVKELHDKALELLKDAEK